MSHRKRASRLGPLPDISSASIHQLSAMPAKVLRLHLANHHLITTGTKITMARWLFDAIHSVSSAITTPITIIGTSPASITTSTPESMLTTVSSPSASTPQTLSLSSASSTPTQLPAISGGFTFTQLSTVLQLLSQALQQNPLVPVVQSSNPAIQSSVSPSPLIPTSSALPIFSMAQHNPIITLPTTLAAPVTHVPPLHPQENEDALSTTLDVPPPATTRPSQRMNLSLLLPPVPTSIQQRIVRGEFIDFNTLLPEVMFSTANITSSPNATRSTSQTLRINSFSTWLDVWNIYIATVVAHNPSRAAELLGYQRLIHSASKHFSTSAWLNYDMQFRTLAASNPQLQWNLHHSELWLDRFIFTKHSLALHILWEYIPLS